MGSIVHFDLPVDDPKRAVKFYSGLFGWKFTKAGGGMEYYFIEIPDDTSAPLRGGMGLREDPAQRITNYIGVPSVDEYLEKVVLAGGKVVLGRQAVPGFGYLAQCLDTEGNLFGLWQEEPTVV